MKLTREVQARRSLPSDPPLPTACRLTALLLGRCLVNFSHMNVCTTPVHTLQLITVRQQLSTKYKMKQTENNDVAGPDIRVHKNKTMFYKSALP